MNKRPNIPHREHPIYTGNYNIQTISLDDLRKEVENWIDNRNPGGIISGRPRVGKTRAIYFLKMVLKETYGDELPIIIFNMSEHKQSERFFYYELLNDLNHSYALPGRGSIDLKTNAINQLITFGKSNEMHRLVLIIDEANFLYEQDYNYLMDIYNRLERANVQLTVLLVGTDEIISVKQMLIQTNKQQIVGRFMVCEHRFYGVRTVKDLQICLASYDYCEYPDESGWSFTKFFFPEAYEEGNRVSNMANDLIECFKNLKPGKQIEIPMQYVARTIENCFRKFGADGLCIYFPTKEYWDKSILASGYMKAEILSDMCNKVIEGAD